MVFESIPSGFYLKSRPKSYRSRDAAYAVGGNPGVVLARLPKDYPLTSQQRRIKEVAQRCNIRKGMSKADLQRAMKECVANAF